MSELKVKYITGTIGEGEENSPITFSGDTATLGTGTTLGSTVTFPTGMMLQIVDNPITSIITRSVSTTLGAFSTPFNVTISNCLSTSKILGSC